MVVVGSANTDFLIRGPKLPAAGETVEGREFHEGAGGTWGGALAGGTPQSVAAGPGFAAAGGAASHEGGGG